MKARCVHGRRWYRCEVCWAPEPAKTFPHLVETFVDDKGYTRIVQHYQVQISKEDVAFLLKH